MRLLIAALGSLFLIAPTPGRQILEVIGGEIAHGCRGEEGFRRCGTRYVDVESFRRGMAGVESTFSADSLPGWLRFTFEDLPTARAYRCKAGQRLDRCDMAHRGTHLRMESLVIEGDRLVVGVMDTRYEGSVRPGPYHASHATLYYRFAWRDGAWKPLGREVSHSAR